MDGIEGFYEEERTYAEWQVEVAKKEVPELPHPLNCRECPFFCKRAVYKSKRLQNHCDYTQEDLTYDVSGRYIKPRRECPWKR